ncbi:Transposon Ty3-G Gag-Pol polyprotein [Labeo rohita]|uniref:ribonuclease H n=1 Tax=Labeo rohita TaxID=84645 RepID=A0ABQ8MV97_LABRO|nr:Transposon Ty3-G Gag-Pol polyprotein [Labeo rohita]
MSLRPCASACGSFLASLDGHDHCLTCLGREHAEAAFTDGSCVHCECMTMAALKSRRSFMRRLPLLPSRGKSLSRQGFSAAAARHLGDLQVTVQNVPPASKAPLTSASPRGPVEWPEQYTSPHAGPSVSFGAPQEVEMSASASEGESEGEADLPADQRHAPPPSTFLPGGARGRGGLRIHLAHAPAPLPSPPSTAGQPRVMWQSLRACKLSSALAGRAYHATGQAATALHAMATLQVYQAKALKHLHEGGPDQGAMQELRAASDFALRATKVTAHSLGQGGLFGDTVVDFAQQFSAPALSPTEAHNARLAARRHRAGRSRAVPPAPSSNALHPRIRSQRSISPAREPGKKVSTAQCSQTFLQDVFPSGISPLPLPPPGCPTAVMSVNVPLIPLANRLGAWLQLPSPSQWLIRTVRLGYAIQFTRRPPRYRGVLSTSVHSDTHAAVLSAEVAVLLAKDAIEPVPPAEMKSGFYNPYFIVPKKSGGLSPILDLQALNRSLLRLSFKMLTTKRMLTCIRHQDWFAAIELKDAYFHISILPRHRPFLQFAFEGRAYQYKVLPFGLSLSPRVFTKVAEAALSSLWRMGIRILNYLDDWLLIAHSRDVLCEHRDLVLRHLSHLGLQVKREKSKLSPVQRISFLGVELDSVNMTARLTNEQAPGAYGSCSRGDAAGLASYETASALVTRSSPEMGMTPWHTPDWRFPAVSPPVQPMVRPGLSSGRSPSGTSLQASCGLHECLFHGLGCCMQWASSLRLLDRTLTAMAYQLPRVVGCASCAASLPTDAAPQTRACSHRQHCDRSLYQPPRWSSLPSHVTTPVDSDVAEIATCRSHSRRTQPCSRPALTAVHPSWRMATPPPGSPADLEPFRRSPDRSVHFPRILPLPAVLLPQRGSPRQGCAGTQRASRAQVRLSPSEPPCTDTVQDQGGRGVGSADCTILAHLDLVSRPHFPHGSPSLEDPLEEKPSFSGDGHNLAPASRPMEPARLAPGRDASDLSGLSQAVIETITQSRAPSTRQAYALRWGLFVDWCSSLGEDPQRCPIAVVLSFLQEKLERRLSPSTLKVYVAAIAAYHDAVDGASLGKHQLVVRFLRGARRVNPPRPHLVPSWDLAVTLQGLREAPFEPLASVELKYLSLKTALLTVLASIKRIGDLQAFSVDEACLEFGPGDSHVILRPRPGYVPKVPTTPFRDQVVNLQALPLEEADPASALLCPVRARRIYVDCTRHFRRTEQLFVCFGGQQKGMLSPNRGWPIGW